MQFTINIHTAWDGEIPADDVLDSVLDLLKDNFQPGIKSIDIKAFEFDD